MITVPSQPCCCRSAKEAKQACVADILLKCNRSVCRSLCRHSQESPVILRQKGHAAQ
ncbi:uncharacterized protein B0I36DRAFT_318625 [Microdochium trichocladiopsis]|uniref:Uncharacterized protein n=1 Tax=Microdochium trichocladiopsis TaxID=1682393 RepID=A0A9P8YCK8_9PEZI|nr:uncharacterized protein B0I36DRAFT_318625 [Microdochium trichocladiopsis]KAH7035574.1 hypothetical protein B0I36DRAFT_318625 [Microdochium trichocladiopsis]